MGRGATMTMNSAGRVRASWSRPRRSRRQRFWIPVVAAAEVPGSAALNVDGNAQVLSVSCVAGGYCVAGGFYTDQHDHTQAFVDGTK
jgi:hypothetical protein